MSPPARPVRDSAAAPEGTHPEQLPRTSAAILGLQGAVGNRSVTRMLRVSRQARLRTSQDSRLRVIGEGEHDAYRVQLQVGDAVRDVATMRILGCTDSSQLPVHLEDFVDTDGNRAWVVFSYLPGLVRLRVPDRQFVVDGVTVDVETHAVEAAELRAPAAQVPRDDRSRAVETVRDHLGSSDIDTILAAVVSAEGGFGTTQTYDRAVLTWGQGQWTAHSGTLQRALRFVIDRRPDLWSRYFDTHRLSVEAGANPRFVHEGEPVANTPAALARVFRPDAETSRRWVTVFSQFGLDPQVQRLQREYLRGDVRRELARTHAGNRPEDWLTTRGKALLFSMQVNHPVTAYQYFREAVAAAGGGHAGTPVPEAIRTAVSDDLEDRFRRSGIRAFQSVAGRNVENNAVVQIPRHHTLGFWGTQGRDRGVADCDTAIGEFAGGQRIVEVGGAQVRDPWTAARWQQHRQRLAARETRYEKSVADIAAALNREDVQPEVPPPYRPEADAGGGP